MLPAGRNGAPGSRSTTSLRSRFGSRRPMLRVDRKHRQEDRRRKVRAKFTPRRDCTKWSALNKRRLRKLIREGRMTEPGLAKIDLATLGEEPRAKPGKGDPDIPRFVKQALMANAKAWENFQNLAPSHRR